jgi:hypothetical protein
MKINMPNKLTIDLNKTNVQDLIAEGMNNEDFRTKLARLLSPIIYDKFSGYPEYNSRTVGTLNEDGTAVAVLKIVKTRPKKEENEHTTENNG